MAAFMDLPRPATGYRLLTTALLLLFIPNTIVIESELHTRTFRKHTIQKNKQRSLPVPFCFGVSNSERTFTRTSYAQCLGRATQRPRGRDKRITVGFDHGMLIPLSTLIGYNHRMQVLCQNCVCVCGGRGDLGTLSKTI